MAYRGSTRFSDSSGPSKEGNRVDFAEGEDTPLKPRRRIGNIDVERAEEFLQFLAVFLVPLGLYATTVALYNFLFYTLPATCVMFSLLSLFFAGLLILARGKVYLFMALGAACVLATVTGTVGGLYCYDTYGIFAFMYGSARKYTNVVPTRPAAAVRDAGRLVFTTETKVDGKNSIGFVSESGRLWCAAPVVDGSEAPRVEYWAVGYNCCEFEGSFSCDAAGTTAHSGIVVLDNNGWFAYSNKDYYDLARKKAEAVYNLNSVEDPIYVRWVSESDLYMLRDQYRTKAWLFLVLTSLAFGLASAGLASTLRTLRP